MALCSHVVAIFSDLKVSSKQAKKVFEIMMKENKDPEVIVEEKGMKQISDEATLVALINEVLDNNPKSIQDYANGKDHAIKYLVGQVMKATKGQANPRKTNELLSSMLKERIN